MRYSIAKDHCVVSLLEPLNLKSVRSTYYITKWDGSDITALQTGMKWDESDATALQTCIYKNERGRNILNLNSDSGNETRAVAWQSVVLPTTPWPLHLYVSLTNSSIVFQINPYSAGIDFRRQKLTSVDGRFWRTVNSRTIGVNIFLMAVGPYNNTGIQMKQKELRQQF